MKKLLAGGALLTAVLVAAAVLVIPALAHGGTSGTNAPRFNNRFTAADLFALEHGQAASHSNAGNSVSDGHRSAFSFSCTDYGADQGHRVVSVTQSIINDADSGEAGDYWASDTVRRSITMWNVGTDQYCVVVKYYDSSFQAFAGQISPGKGGTLSGEESGAFAGSAIFTISGALTITDPAEWPQFGVVNHGAALDYQCDMNGNCPGYVSFLSQYFAAGYTFDEPQWGWTYIGKDSGHNPPSSAGTWVNSYTGTYGDILDSDD